MRVLALLFFIIGLFFVFLIISTNFNSEMTDAKFHIEIVRRIQAGEPVNKEIVLEIPPNWAYPNGTIKTWDSLYITSYPKLFHVATSTLPFEAKQSVGIMVAFLFCALLLGIYLIAGMIGGDLAAWVSVVLFLMLPKLLVWNYTWYYLNMVFAQLMLNVFIVWAVLIVLIMINKGLVIPVVALGVVSIIIFSMTHNIFYSFEKILENLTRLVPILLSIGIPVFIGALSGTRSNTKVYK